MIETNIALISFGLAFLGQFGAFVYGYGKLTQKIDAQGKAEVRLEKNLLEANKKLDSHIQYHLLRSDAERN